MEVSSEIAFDMSPDVRFIFHDEIADAVEAPGSQDSCRLGADGIQHLVNSRMHP